MQHSLAAHTAYNVFGRKRQPALRCAVRQDRPVPSFVRTETWAFIGTTTIEQPSPGFRPEAATGATRFTGYYLFHALDG